MNTRLVFKFRDDLNLFFYRNLYEPLDLSPDSDYASEFKKAIRNSLPENLPTPLKTKLDSLIQLITNLNSKIDHGPLYLFRYSPIDLFNTIQDRVDTINDIKKNLMSKTGKKETLYHMPSFYHCFEYLIPEDWPADELDDLIDGFENFLPFERPFGRMPNKPPVFIDEEFAGSYLGDAYLLDFAYLKDGGIEAEAGSLDIVKTQGGNQDYLHRMGIISAFSERSLRDIPPEEDQWIGILEVHGWNTAHPEFENARNQNQMVVLTKHQSEDDESIRLQDILVNQREDNLGLHGTKTLGIILSRVNPGDIIDCQGIVPNAKVALSSAIMEVPENQISIAKASEYSEENGFAFILKFSLSKPPGQVILIEFSTGAYYPIVIQPVFSYLVTLASSLGHIVIVPAGNGSKKITALPVNKLRRDTRKILNFWKREFRHIRSIYQDAPYLLVGAASYSEQLMVLCNNSNWGINLIRVYAQGEKVLTTSSDAEMYDIMGETSAASAIMAGVVRHLQSFAIHKHQQVLSPIEMIQILTNSGGIPVYKRGATGTVTNEVVGIIPNVSEAMRRIERWNTINPIP